MSSTEPTTASKPARSRRSRKQPPAAAPKDAPPPASKTLDVSAERRRSLIAESAYLRAERRGFMGGDPVQDWLDSEKEVDRLLAHD